MQSTFGCRSVALLLVRQLAIQPTAELIDIIAHEGFQETDVVQVQLGVRLQLIRSNVRGGIQLVAGMREFGYTVITVLALIGEVDIQGTQRGIEQG